MDTLAKHAMPFALKGSGVDSDELTSLMLKMNADKSESPKQSMILRRVHAPKKIKIIRRLKPVGDKGMMPLSSVKYPVFLRDTPKS